MRTRVLVLVALAALALAGCGNHNLVVKVDVLSYLDAEQRSAQVDTLPPGDLPLPIALLPDLTINLISGLDNATDVRTATLSLGGLVSAGNGSGSGRLRLYLSDEATPPLTTSPVMDVPVTFSAASPTTVASEATCPPEVAQLFTHQRMRLAMVIDSVVVAAPGAGGLSLTLQRLDATVIAGRKSL